MPVSFFIDVNFPNGMEIIKKAGGLDDPAFNHPIHLIYKILPTPEPSLPAKT